MNGARNLTKDFVVTTSVSGVARKLIWKSTEPLKIGFPIQWVMESTQEGVRITYLGGKSGRTATDRVREVSYAQLKKNPDLVLQSDSERELQIHITPAASIIAPFAPTAERAGATEKGERFLGVYRTLGEWVVESHRIQNGSENEYVAQIGTSPVFKLTRKSESVQITALTSQLYLISASREKKELQPQTGLQLSPQELADSTLRFGNNTWRFGWILKTALAKNTHALPTIDSGIDHENPLFKKQLRNSAIGLVALIALSFIWPKPSQDELVPPQFAKIVLAPMKHAASASSESAPSQTVAQKKVQETAVVQAFRAQALQSAVSNLMKGGMTRLLAQSDFVAGHRADSEASHILDSQSKDLRATAPQIGGLDSKNVAVASLGGEGTPGSNGKAVGYGKGEHAAVSGQGKGFVSMDIANSSVEDGLTKDEVGEVIHRHLSEVRYCYESAMIRTPDIEGKLIVDFTIGGGGAVKTAEAKQSTLPDPRLDDCIIRRLVTWKFPTPKGGVEVAVTYPFIFKTLGR